MAKTVESEISNEAVGFGRIGIGDSTATLPVRMDKALLSGARSEKLFCGARCEARCVIDPAGEADADGQEKMLDTSQGIGPITVDIPSYRSSKKHRSFTMTLSLSELGEAGLSDLAHFSMKPGKLTLKYQGDAPERRGRPRKEEPEDFGGEG